MKKNKTIEFFISNLKEEIDENKLNLVKKDSYEFYNYLIKKYANDSKKLQKQTLNNMFPIMSVYKGLRKNEFEEEYSLDLLDKIKIKMTLKNAKSLSKILKVFGLYKIYPTMFKKVTLSSFSSDIGFDPEFVVANKNICKFNMKKCVFCERCRAENCFELVKVFCHSDVTMNTNLHPNIIWHRDGTIGDGAEVCDFEVSLKKTTKK